MTLAPLDAVREALAAEGGLVAGALAPAGEADDGLGRTVAQGPRAAAQPGEYAFIVEAIHEGYLLHYGAPRLVRTDDADLALLAGDRLYALGLARLAALGDLEAVEALADVIADGARAQAGGDADLAAAVWAAGVTRVGWGDDPALAAAREAARAGTPGASEALLTAARQVAPDMAQVR